MSKTSIDKKHLVEQFGLKISQLACRMIQNKDLAQEAAQEVWFEIIKSIDTFKGESNISTWIFTIAKRTILRFSNSERIYSTNEINNHFELESIDYHGPEEDKEKWVKEKCDHCLTAFCHCLNNESRLIFLLRDIAGLPYSQISIIMEMEEQNIRQNASRSKVKVRNFMNRNCVLYNPQGACKCRIQKHVVSVDLHKAYDQLAKAARLVNIFQKFDKELPRKNYWEKFVTSDVTI